MKGYIAEKYNNMNNAYTSARFMEEGMKAGLDMQIVGVFDTVDTGSALINNGRVLDRAALVINRYKYGNIKDKLAALGEKSINPAEKINEYIDKSRQRTLVSRHMTHPVSLLANAGLPFEAAAEAVGLPFVTKGLCGSQGDMVCLVENREDYAAVCRRFDGSELLFQQFISTSEGRDVRMLAVKGEVAGCMQRTAKSGFRANFALGADVSEYRPDSDIKAIAADIYRQTGADVLGIDLLFGSDGYVFCEINITPGIEGIETACGCNAAGRIIDMAMNGG